MKVVLGITDKEVEAIEYISNFIHLLYDDEDFEGELSDQDCEKFDRWFDMMDAIDKIKFVDSKIFLVANNTVLVVASYTLI